MGSSAFERIMEELTVHPKERIGFDRGDFATLAGDGRRVVFEELLGKVEDGRGYAEQLEWLLDDDYVSTLRRRLDSLPPAAHGRVYLSYYLYLKTGERKYICRMMQGIVAADPVWEGRERALGGYLRDIIGSEPLFLDFCRYIILNVPGRSIKEEAMLWLAYEKGYPLDGMRLPGELAGAVSTLDATNGTDAAARGLLDQVHSDTGGFDPSSLVSQ